MKLAAYHSQDYWQTWDPLNIKKSGWTWLSNMAERKLWAAQRSRRTMGTRSWSQNPTTKNWTWSWPVAPTCAMALLRVYGFDSKVRAPPKVKLHMIIRLITAVANITWQSWTTVWRYTEVIIYCTLKPSQTWLIYTNLTSLNNPQMSALNMCSQISFHRFLKLLEVVAVPNWTENPARWNHTDWPQHHTWLHVFHRLNSKNNNKI